MLKHATKEATRCAHLLTWGLIEQAASHRLSQGLVIQSMSATRDQVFVSLIFQVPGWLYNTRTSLPTVIFVSRELRNGINRWTSRGPEPGVPFLPLSPGIWDASSSTGKNRYLKLRCPRSGADSSQVPHPSQRGQPRPRSQSTSTKKLISFIPIAILPTHSTCCLHLPTPESWIPCVKDF